MKIEKFYVNLQVYLVQIKLQGVPQATSNQTASMGLHYDLEDKSETLRRLNH